MDDRMADGESRHNKRTFWRTFVFLEKPVKVAPSNSEKRWDTLTKNGRVKDLTFTRQHSAADIGRLLLASFPLLLGSDLDR